ncbi:hypothetical protein TRIUR3_14442 [Triticum urartu]|uniref:Uncharacterized protein n=1 Tax=Triticum urartu TaxID=4572 RepID=M8AF85_TRIUA|nr:hypothetical protein TRIUR3_14442 [Triticum urartu]
MDAFGWSTQPPVTTVPSCPTDDALLAAFLGAGSFEELHSAGAGDGTVCSDAYHGGLDLPSCQSDLSLLRCQDGVALPGHGDGDASSNVFLDSAGCFLPAIAGAHDGLHDRFAFVPDDPAQAAGSNTAFSGISDNAYSVGADISVDDEVCREIRVVHRSIGIARGGASTAVRKGQATDCKGRRFGRCAVLGQKMDIVES